MVVVKEGLKKHSYTVTIEGIDYNVVIQEPEFKQLALAMGKLITQSGGLDLVGAGNIIYELCCVECPVEVSSSAKVLVSLCLTLASDFVTPADTVIKKN